MIKERVHIDGTMPDDTLQPDDEAVAPFFVFDPNLQKNVAGPFGTRSEAQMVADRVNLMAEHWADFAGTRRTCRLEGMYGPLDGFAQFPVSPEGRVTVYTADTAPQQVQITTHLLLAMRRCLDAARDNCKPIFYYS